MYQPSMFENHHHILDHMTTSSTHKASESTEVLGKSRLLDDDFETKSGTETTTDAPSGDEQDPNNTGPRPKRKRYHRHTQRQIQEMEA